MIELSRYLDAL